MALRRDRRRIGAASATLSAGALVFFAAGTAPASADTRSAATGTTECKLGALLCGLLGAGAGTPATPPKSPSGGASTKPAAKPPAKTAARPKPKPKPAVRPAPAHHGASSGGAPLPVGGVPELPVPGSAQTPALPDVADQDPLVLPEAGPEGQAPPARLVAESAPAGGDTVPPLLVATASGLVGAIAALNLSMLRRRRSR